jgi:hypothetical protein
MSHAVCKSGLLSLPFICMAIFAPGCADKIISENDLLSSRPVQGIQLSKLSEIQNQIFNPSCAIAGCHGGSSPQANLNLSEGKSYLNLVGVQSVLYPPAKRVQSGNSSQSILIQILRGTVGPRMPYQGQPLSSASIDSIAAWIDKGAPND